MGFLDNSGDIILDAVLTDVGRKKLANGDFRIAKFAVGDDEIDYRLFDAQHASGSAYYDLEILQSPVLEAGTKNVSSINYGLTTYSRNDILYLPVLKINEKPSLTTALTRKDNLFLLAYDGPTQNDFSTAAIPYLNTTKSERQRTIHLETGLDSDGTLPRTVTTKNSYLLNTNLIDESFNVFYDTRFIKEVYGVSASDKNSNIAMTTDRTSTPTYTNPNLVLSSAETATLEFLPSYKAKLVYSIKNDIYNNYDLDLNLSSINGPRGSLVYLNFDNNDGFSFALNGKTGQTLYGLSGTFSYVDTIVYVVGTNTGVNIQLPIRIIKKD